MRIVRRGDAARRCQPRRQVALNNAELTPDRRRVGKEAKEAISCIVVTSHEFSLSAPVLHGYGTLVAR